MLGVEEVSTFTEKVGVPLIVAMFGLVASLAAAAATLIGTRLSEAAARRREAYSDAVRSLVRYVEFPYRIKRRTSDDAEELRRLVEVGHEIQEALSRDQMWVTADKRWVGDVLREVREMVSEPVGSSASDAWDSSPVIEAAQMNLSGWGPGDLSEAICRFQRAASCRFGWRRFVTAVPLWRARLCGRKDPR